MGENRFYYPVSVFKLLVMSFFSFGLYVFYVWYQNWEYIRQRNQDDRSSFWRAFWMIFTVYALFHDVDECARHRLKHGISGCYFFATCFLASLLLGIYMTFTVDMTNPQLDLFFLIVNYLGLLALLPLQLTINRLNLPEHIDSNFRAPDRWVLLVCILAWALLIYAIFFNPALLPSPSSVLMNYRQIQDAFQTLSTS